MSVQPLNGAAVCVCVFYWGSDVLKQTLNSTSLVKLLLPHNKVDLWKMSQNSSSGDTDHSNHMWCSKWIARVCMHSIHRQSHVLLAYIRHSVLLRARVRLTIFLSCVRKRILTRFHVGVSMMLLIFMFKCICSRWLVCIQGMVVLDIQDTSVAKASTSILQAAPDSNVIFSSCLKLQTWTEYCNESWLFSKLLPWLWI